MQQNPGNNPPIDDATWDDQGDAESTTASATSEPGPAFNEQSNLPPVVFPSIYVHIPHGTSDQQRQELIAQALAAAPEPAPVAPAAPAPCAGAIADTAHLEHTS